MKQDFASTYGEVVDLFLERRGADAQVRLASVPGYPETFRRMPGRGVAKQAQLAVFRRDGFCCRYCARRVLLPPVLRLLSVSFEDVFPYHLHGRMDVCHLAFWRDLASCDHLMPIARGGSSGAENLVTACYMCNSTKQNWLVEELGWEMVPATGDQSWDGLSGVYPALLARVREEHAEAGSSYFTSWLGVVTRAYGQDANQRISGQTTVVTNPSPSHGPEKSPF